MKRNGGFILYDSLSCFITFCSKFHNFFQHNFTIAGPGALLTAYHLSLCSEHRWNKFDTVGRLYFPVSITFAHFRMTSKIMITYKRKRVTSQDHTADDTLFDSSPAASSNVVASNLPPKFEGHAENTIANEDNFVRILSCFSSCLYCYLTL